MIFNLYKAKDFSSFDIVKKVKYITKEKVGHSGTLDPFADGVLVLGVGKSTKKLSDIIKFFGGFSKNQTIHILMLKTPNQVSIYLNHFFVDLH